MSYVQCGLCEGSLEVVTPEFFCCMNQDCHASYKLEHDKTGYPIDWQEDPRVKIRIEKRFADMETAIQQQKNIVLARREKKRENLELKNQNKHLKYQLKQENKIKNPQPFF